MKILVFGSLNMDCTYYVENFVKPGETISSINFETFCGGKGLNQAIACKKAGGEVYMAGKIGADGKRLLSRLQEFGIDTKHITISDKEHSGHAIIQVEKSGANNIILYSGTNGTITPAQVDAVLEVFTENDIILLQNEIFSLPYIIEKSFKKGMKIILNPSPINQEILNCDFAKVFCLIMNQLEAAEISGCEDPDKAMKTLQDKYPSLKIVITLGSEGVKYFDGNQVYQHGIYKVNVLDTTGAGDTFTGYFVTALLEGKAPMEILSHASKASAIAVSRKGASDSIPSKEEVENSIF